MTLSSDEINAIHNEADCLATADQLDQALDSMAQDIKKELADSCPLVLSVMNGGLIPTAQLILKLDFPLELDYLHATRYGDAVEGAELEWKVYPATSIENRTVLVVDDIFDQGHTLEAVCKYLSAKGAKQVLSAVVINKLHDRKVDFRPDYIGLEIEDRFLYGFGMDYKGYLRNANGIYAVKGL
ncbi:hypoxanthine-guanine phosphoribosyltransferase [Motiliproteus sp. MSK22-1]|nr:hypoxanthine-guanine phosphoribosyltransferase [Motiliproteus sp. MSK22-1]